MAKLQLAQLTMASTIISESALRELCRPIMPASVLLRPHTRSVICVTPGGLTDHYPHRVKINCLQPLSHLCRALAFALPRTLRYQRMHKIKVFFVIFSFSALLITQAVAQTEPASSASSGSQMTAGPIGPANIWKMPDNFIREAHLACDNAPPNKSGAPPDFAGCFIDQMSKSGAPAGAIEFTRMYQRHSNGEVAIMNDFKKVGPVDLAAVVYPLRANDNTGVLMVNGDPKVLDSDDMKYLDRKTMEDDWAYKAVKEKYPKADIWPTSVAPGSWPGSASLPDGGIGFLFGYPMLDGCHACRHVGLQRFRWDFDRHGKFLHTTYMFSPPPPKQHVPREMKPTPTEAPALNTAPRPVARP